MNELTARLVSILKAKQPPDKDRALQELKVLDKYDVVGDMLRLYTRVKEDPSIQGSTNKLNSYLAFVLGITTAKPDGDFVLEKRRTYARDGFPDIDMDFCCFNRHLIIDHLIDKYGRDYVGNIGTFGTLKTKSAIKKVVKVLDPEDSVIFDKNGQKIKDEPKLNFALQNEITKSLPGLMKRADGSEVKNIEEAYKEYTAFRKYMDAYPDVYKYARRMEGGLQSYGVHAAGVVISPVPLATITPLHVTKRAKKRKNEDDDDISEDTLVATQFDAKSVESLGLIKFDILGLSTISAVDWAHRWIKENHGVDLDLGNLPLDDKLTLDLLNSGKTSACFQVEGLGMQQTLMQIGIDSFEDLVVAVAMYRPGPKDYIPDYAGRKRGSIPVKYPHEIMKRIIDSTYGIMVYQEQVMKIFMAMADLTSSDGYTFTKGCAKKKRAIIEDYRERFIRRSVGAGIEESIVKRVWNDMEKFGGYAFNRSHACSYAYESYKTAYLKAHYPMEFMAARMSVELQRRRYEDVERYEADCERMGITLENPDLNRSKLVYTITGEKSLRKPIIMRDVGMKAGMEIIKNQPYEGPDMLFSFVNKTGHAVNTTVMQALTDCKVFGSKKKQAILDAFEQIKSDKRRSKGQQTGDLFG